MSLTFGEKNPSQAPISSYISTRSDIGDVCLVSIVTDIRNEKNG